MGNQDPDDRGVGGGAPDAQREGAEDEEDALENEIQALEDQLRDYRARQRRLKKSLTRAMNQNKDDNNIKRLQDELAKTVGDLKSANALLAGKSKVPGYVTEYIHEGVCDLLEKAHRDWKNEADSLKLSVSQWTRLYNDEVSKLKVVNNDRDNQSRMREEVLAREVILREDYQSLLIYSRELLRRFERNWQEIVRVQQGLHLTGWYSVEALNKEPVRRV